jgi:predicted acylesterase/phospholipase RssA
VEVCTVHTLPSRLRLSWLTIAALIATALVATIRPTDVDVVDVEYAGNVDAFREALAGPPAARLRIQTVNVLRGHLAADMVFLVAYGLLLRASALAVGKSGRSLAVAGAVMVMLADATENIAALAILRRFGEEANPSSPAWLFLTMNAAAVTKWAVAGCVLVYLGNAWRTERTKWTGLLKWVATGVALGFVVGGLASLATAAGLWIPGARVAARAALIAPGAAFLLQFRLLDLMGLMLRFLNLARVPVLILVIAAAFGPAALGPAVDLLGGIIVVGNFIGIFLTAFSTMCLLFACGTQINLVRAYSADRAPDVRLAVLQEQCLERPVFLTGLVAGASLLFSVGLASIEALTTVFAGTVAGALAALTFIFIVEWIAAYLSDHTGGRPLPQLAVPFRDVPTLASWLLAASKAAPPAIKAHLIGWPLSKVFGVGTGYVGILNGKRQILPGHTFASVQFALSFAIFMWLLSGKLPGADPGFYRTVGAERVDAELWVPTVASIVLLLILAGWTLSAITFFFDRYRTPLFTVAIAAASIFGTPACTEYEVATQPRAGTYTLATPAAVMKAIPARPLVIAAAGGGIQAGAWTARVLQGLDEEIRSAGGTLIGRTAAVSSVSGGSMGALFFGAYNGSQLAEATDQALKPSLDEIATALVGSDVFRAVGIPLGMDRGEALGQTWALRIPAGLRSQATLRAWSEKTRRFAEAANTTAFPAFLFNSTLVETGQPIVFATTQFPSRGYRATFDQARQYPAAESANRILRLMASDDGEAADIGLTMATAARLSAAFPFVSPAATLSIDGTEPYHLVDGGYYDNYGLTALTQWLDDALDGMTKDPATPQLPPRIDVVIIRGLASTDSALTDRLRRGNVNVPRDGNVERHGAPWQLVAPPATALNARSFAQWAGGIQLFKLLVAKWHARKVEIVPRLFDYPAELLAPVCQGSPLSWKLTQPQQDCIKDGWTKLAARERTVIAELR